MNTLLLIPLALGAAAVLFVSIVALEALADRARIRQARDAETRAALEAAHITMWERELQGAES